MTNRWGAIMSMWTWVPAETPFQLFSSYFNRKCFAVSSVQVLMSHFSGLHSSAMLIASRRTSKLHLFSLSINKGHILSALWVHQYKQNCQWRQHLLAFADKRTPLRVINIFTDFGQWELPPRGIKKITFLCVLANILKTSQQPTRFVQEMSRELKWHTFCVCEFPFAEIGWTATVVQKALPIKQNVNRVLQACVPHKYCSVVSNWIKLSPSAESNDFNKAWVSVCHWWCSGW